MEYTRGDWVAYRDNITLDCVAVDLKHEKGKLPYTEIATVYHSRDAHLICSAPAMYEALKALIVRLDGGLALGENADLSQARAALSKAEGKVE